MSRIAHVPFSDAFIDITRRYNRIGTRDLAPTGAVRVIDQSSEGAPRYTDLVTGLDAGPVVIFGDHTRAVKYADESFALGADGTKVLKPAPSLDPRFAYHWLAAQRIESLGYSRHFKLLKELEVPVPAIDDQRRIADILDRADKLAGSCRSALGALGSLSKLLFDARFGDPHAPRYAHRSLTLAEAGIHLRSGGTPSKTTHELWNGSIPWYSPKDMKAFALTDSKDHVSAAATNGGSLSIRQTGSVAFVVRGMILAHTFPVSILRTPGLINQDMKVIEPTPEWLPEFLALNLSAQSNRVLDDAETSAHGTKRLGPLAMGNLRVVDATLDEQHEFVQAVSRISALGIVLQARLESVDALRSALADRSFKGEL